MNAKEYLSQAIWLDRVITNKLEQKEELEALAKRVTVDFTQEKVSGGKATRSPMEDATVKLIDLSNEINDDIDEYVDLKKEIMGTIKQVDDIRYRLILKMRYISAKDWDDIVIAMGYDRSTVFRNHKKALKEVDEILKMRPNATRHRV
jgi:DNA-directed RNA polymerase specialized sigma subunit